MTSIIIGIVLFVLISGLIMVGTNILYNLAAAVVPFVAILMVVVGILMGFFVAIKNTFTVYRDIYFRRGK